MTTVDCPECGEETFSSVDRCPTCETPIDAVGEALPATDAELGEMEMKESNDVANFFAVSGAIVAAIGYFGAQTGEMTGLFAIMNLGGLAVAVVAGFFVLISS